MFFETHAWFFLALATAVMWGFGYALCEYILRNSISPSFLMVVECFLGFFICLGICFFTGSLKPGIETLMDNKVLFLWIIVTCLATIIGMFLIYHAITLKNATLANLVEITYPLFTFLFAWLLFKDVQLTWGTLAGGVLVLAGLVVIFLKSEAG